MAHQRTFISSYRTLNQKITQVDTTGIEHKTGTSYCNQDSSERRYQPDPCHADPVDFQDGKLHRYRDTVTAFLQDIERVHEEQTQYNPHTPDINANNFSWVLQRRSNLSLAAPPEVRTDSRCSKFIDNYEHPMIRLLQRKEELAKEIPDTHKVVLAIAYHHTTLDCIRDHLQWQGFHQMSPRPTPSAIFSTSIMTGITETPLPYNGTFYTGFNPFSFHKTRQTDQCILVLQLTVVPKKTDESSSDTILNSIQALPSSDYAIPLMKFPSDLIETLLCNIHVCHDKSTGSRSTCPSYAGNDAVYKYYTSLQSVVDKYWNPEVTVVPIASPLKVKLCNYYDVRYCHHRRSISALNTELPTSAYTVQYIAPEITAISCLPGVTVSPHWECAICLNDSHDLTSSQYSSCGALSRMYNHPNATGAVSLVNCSHIFHRQCIDECVRRTKKYTCPLCRAPIPMDDIPPPDVLKYDPERRTLGSMPSGTMQIEICRDLFADRDLEFSTGSGVICMVCRFPAGVQKGHHPCPGRRYKSVTYITYLPNCVAGCELLERLTYAFVYGHLFTLRHTSTGRISPAVGSIGTDTSSAFNFVDEHQPSSHLALCPFSVHDTAKFNQYLKHFHAELDKLHIPTIEQLIR